MALSTYSGLQSSIANWLGRDGDSTIVAVIPDAIALVETKLNRVLRVSQMEDSETLTGTDGVFTLPTDFVGWRQVRDSSCGPLELVMPDWASENYPTSQAGPPKFFTIKGATLTTYPATTSTVTLDYYQTIPALSDTNTTNWLLTGYPDVYLYMALVEVNAFTKNPQDAALWNERAAAAVDELRSQDLGKRFMNVKARVKGPTP